MVLIVILTIIIGTIMFIHGASIRRPEWCQSQLDDEQMKEISKIQRKKDQCKDKRTGRDL